MNLYLAQIELNDDAKALAFSHAVDQWMTFLMDRKAIASWRMLRRKLNLASDECFDFLIEIEVNDLAQLDAAFRVVGSQDDDAERLHTAVHQMIGKSRFGLYRPFPDAERAERMAIF